MSYRDPKWELCTIFQSWNEIFGRYNINTSNKSAREEKLTISHLGTSLRMGLRIESLRFNSPGCQLTRVCKGQNKIRFSLYRGENIWGK